MHFLLPVFFLFIGCALCEQQEGDILTYVFYCRLRVSNISEGTAEVIRRHGEFQPQFEVSSFPDARVTTFWLGGDVGDEPNQADVLYRTFFPEDIVAVNYQDMNKEIGRLSDDQFSFRCSNGSILNTTDGLRIKFIESYNVTLGPASSTTDGLIKRSVTLNRQDKLDCYDHDGFIHPYTLDPWHRYVADGERYVPGCSMVAQCQDGEYGAVSRCAPTMYPSKYIRVRNVGECCDSGIAKADIEEKVCVKNDENVALHSERGGPSPIPWQVRFGSADGSKKCDGVIVNENWFLTTTPCLDDIDVTEGGAFEFLRPDGIRYQPARFRNITVTTVEPIPNGPHSALSLVKLNDSFVINDWTRLLQKVNLPWSKEVCKKMADSGCHVLLGTDQSNETDSSFIIGVTGGSNGDLIPIQKKSHLQILRGSGAVSWYEKAHFLIGIYQPSKDGVQSNDDSDTGFIIRICDFLDAIREKTGEDE